MVGDSGPRRRRGGSVIAVLGRRSRGISNPPAHTIIGWGPSLGQGSVGGLAVVEINETERVTDKLTEWQSVGWI